MAGFEMDGIVSIRGVGLRDGLPSVKSVVPPFADAAEAHDHALGVSGLHAAVLVPKMNGSWMNLS